MNSIKQMAAEYGISKPISLRKRIMTIGNNDFSSLRKQISWVINSNRVFSFSSGPVNLSVPAKGLFGTPPKRAINFDISASSDYVHSSPFYKYDYYHLNGLTETKLSIEETVSSNTPGIHYQWGLKNKNSTPVFGRTAKMKINLLVKRKLEYEISTPRFSTVYSSVRARFFNHFFHNGLIAEGYWPAENKLKFADQPLYMGQALIMLSSEIHILKLRRESGIEDNIKLINIIFDAIENKLLDKNSNGYINRDNIRSKNDPMLARNFSVVESDGQKGRNDEISQDNYIGLMIGLLHISKYLHASSTVSTRATKFIELFFKYMMDNEFWIVRPDGQKVKRGEDARGFVTLLHGLYKKATNNDLFDHLKVDFSFGGNQGVKWVGTIWDKGGILSDIFRLLGQQANPYTLHMAYSLLCSSDVWTQEQLENASYKNHFLSIILYAYYHNTGVMKVPWNNMKNLLSGCSLSGPSNSELIWNRDNIWVRGGTGTPSAGSEIQFNGLDYMVLHNLAQIVYQKKLA